MNEITQLKLAVLIWLLMVLAIASVAGKEPGKTPNHEHGAQVVESDRVKDESDDSSGGSWSRLREGSKITDELGEFQVTADSYKFHMQDDKRVLHVLENLTLERIARTLDADPSPRLWSVSGILTEFRGDNYLLITRAVLKPRQLPRTSETKKEPAAEK